MQPCRKLIFFFAILLCTGYAFAQKTDTTKLNFIKRQCAEINQNLKSYRKTEKTDTIKTAEGNKVLLYYKSNEIKKIAATYYGEAGKETDEFYFSNHNLIFCEYIDYRYNMPISEKNGGKTASTTEERVYLSSGKIFLVKKKPAVSYFFDSFPKDPQKEAKRLLQLK
jgi:hypothetical protein